MTRRSLGSLLGFNGCQWWGRVHGKATGSHGIATAIALHNSCTYRPTKLPGRGTELPLIDKSKKDFQIHFLLSA